MDWAMEMLNSRRSPVLLIGHGDDGTAGVWHRRRIAMASAREDGSGKF